MTLENRIRALFAHHGIDRAHFVGGAMVDGLTRLCTEAPDLAASLTLVCPISMPQNLDQDLAMPLSVISGDTGAGAALINGALAGAKAVHRVTLTDYEALLWSDVATQRTDEVRSALLEFFGRIRSTPLPPVQQAGNVSGISYQARGEGPAVVLFPLGLAPSQWHPLLDDLARHHTVISISGAHVEPTAVLEARADNPGYRAVIDSVIDKIALAPGASILEVGCGCGAIGRRLAERTGRAHPITGVDVNRFLLNEAALLRDEAGLGSLIDLREGDAHALPFEDGQFAATISITMLEEVDADRALAEMVRVTRPGGQVGVAVRSLDITPLIGAELPEPILAKAQAGMDPAGVATGGCADASLYPRMAAAGLTDLVIAPQFNNRAHMLPITLAFVRARLSPSELEVWDAAVAAAGEAFFLGKPMHAAVGTKPLGA